MLYKRCVIVRLSTLQDEHLCLYHQNDVTDCVSFTSLHRAVALIRIITKVHLAPPYLMMRDRIRGELLPPIVLISRVHPLPIFYSSSPTLSFFIRFLRQRDHVFCSAVVGLVAATVQRLHLPLVIYASCGLKSHYH